VWVCVFVGVYVWMCLSRCVREMCVCVVGVCVCVWVFVWACVGGWL